MINTSILYKPIMALSIYLFIIHFISIGEFPPIIIMMVLWVFILKSLNDEGDKVKFSFPIILVDLIIFMFVIGYGALPYYEYTVYLPLILLFILMIFTLISVNQEYMYFGRTVQSMRPKDRKLAVKALKSKDPGDITQVAEYTSWNNVN